MHCTRYKTVNSVAKEQKNKQTQLNRVIYKHIKTTVKRQMYLQLPLWNSQRPLQNIQILLRNWTTQSAHLPTLINRERVNRKGFLFLGFYAFGAGWGDYLHRIGGGGGGLVCTIGGTVKEVWHRALRLLRITPLYNPVYFKWGADVHAPRLWQSQSLYSQS